MKPIALVILVLSSILGGGCLANAYANPDLRDTEFMRAFDAPMHSPFGWGRRQSPGISGEDSHVASYRPNLTLNKSRDTIHLRVDFSSLDDQSPQGDRTYRRMGISCTCSVLGWESLVRSLCECRSDLRTRSRRNPLGRDPHV